MAKQNKSRKLFATTATAALVASAIVPVASAASVNDFHQVPTWAKDAVQYLIDNGTVQGDNNGNFKPFSNLSRAQAAEILSKELNLDATGTENFADVAENNWFYNAVLATSPEIFQGDDKGNFNPNKNLTRQEAAVVIVKAFGLTGSTSLNGFADASKVPGWAKAQFETAVANGVINGKGALLAPQDTITNAEFATMIFRAVEASSNVAVESVTAINATTVEVTYKETVEDVKALNFAIEGLEVSNAVVKQTNNKVVVLTTAAQEAGKTYTVTESGNKVGTFTGVSAVIPTAVKTVVGSQQGVIGKEVTLSAEVTVADGQSKAGIPVTFNITTGAKNNDKIEVEAFTNDKGVATYSYTRYYNGTDDVVAYATSKSSVKDYAKVYWASSALLVVEEAKETNKLANNAKKLYNVEGDKNGIYAVIFKENIDVKSKDAVDAEITDAIGYINEDGDYTALASDKSVETYQYTSGGSRYAIIQLDKDGEGSFNVTGEDVSVTPVVFRIGDEDIDFDLDKTAEISDFEKYLGKDVSYDRTYLQAEGKTVEFALKHSLAIEVQSIGDEDAAAIATVNGNTFDGGRDYKAIVKEEDGKLVGKGTPVYVSVDYAKGDVFLKASSSYSASLVSSVDGEKVYRLLANKNGEINFTLYGEEDAYATPTVFLDNGTKNAALDKKDLQTEGETVYFTDAVVKGSALTVEDEDGVEVKTVAAGERAYFVYQSVAQNDKAYYTSTKAYDATFEVVAGANDVDVYNGNTLLGTVKQGTTKTFVVKSDLKGLAYIAVEGANATSVKVEVSSSNKSLPSKEASVSISKYATGEIVTGTVSGWNDSKDEFYVTDSKNKAHFFSYEGASYKQNGSTITKGKFETLLANATVEISVTRAEDGKLTFDVLAVDNTTPVATKTLDTVVVSDDLTKLTLTFGESINPSTIDLGDFTLANATGVSVASASGKTVVLNVSGVVAGTAPTVTVDADKFAWVDGNANAAIATKTATFAYVNKLSALTVTENTKAATEKVAEGKATIDAVEYTATVATGEPQVAYNGVTIKFVKHPTLDNNVTATYSSSTKTITVELGYDNTNNTVTAINGVIQALTAHGDINFSKITLAGSADVNHDQLGNGVEIKLAGGVNGGVDQYGEYAFTINTNLVTGDVVKFNGKSYVAGNDFTVGTTEAATATNLAAAIAKDTRFATVTASGATITATDAEYTGAAAPTLSFNK